MVIQVSYTAPPPTYAASSTGLPNRQGIQIQPVQFVAVEPETRNCNRDQMPSIGCPIAACLLFFPLGIGSLVCYLQAQRELGKK